MRQTKAPTLKDSRVAASVTSTRWGARSGDVQGRSSEEDLLLFHNLKLLGYVDAIHTWPELTGLKLDLFQSMFSTPNKNATEGILFFLFGILLGTENTKKQFKDVWPATSTAQIREFRTRSIEVIKSHSEWKISNEIQNLIPALLQRCCGQKLVRFLCELSYTALTFTLREMDPEATEGVESTETFLDLNESLMEALLPARMKIGQTKLTRLQKRFLTNVVVAKQQKEDIQSHASAVISVYTEMEEKEAQLEASRSFLESAESKDIDLVDGASTFNDRWNDLESLLKEIAVMLRFVFKTDDLGLQEIQEMMESLVENETHPYAISGERLLAQMMRPLREPIPKLSLSSKESNAFDEASFDTVSIHGQTEVDLLSMTENWAIRQIEKLVELLDPEGNFPQKVFMNSMMHDNTLPDVISQIRTEHEQNVEGWMELKHHLEFDIAQLDAEIEKEMTGPVNTTQIEIPSLLSLLQGEAHL